MHRSPGDGKVVVYAYDSAGNLVKTGAGASGDVDPIEMFYDANTGLVETVRYTNGQSSYDAAYSTTLDHGGACAWKQ